jgi:catechol 2,3-dioxygenase-like lactoylglutathione lyase family enzyme
MMEQRLSIITLGVSDLARAKAFYLDGLGWTAVDQPAEEICFVQMPGIAFSLYPLDKLAEDIGTEPITEVSMGGIALAHNTRSEAETDEVLATAVAAGARVVKPAQKVFWGGYSGYFADLDNHLWEVAFNPFATIADDGSFLAS